MAPPTESIHPCVTHSIPSFFDEFRRLLQRTYSLSQSCCANHVATGSSDLNLFMCSQGTSLARQIGAVAYAECTSRYSENSVRDVFHVTTLASVSRIPHRPPLKRSGSRRGLKRVSQQPPRTEIHECPPAVRKDRAKSCALM